MLSPIPIIPPIPAPEVIYKNDLGKTLAAQNPYHLIPLPGWELPPVKQSFPPYRFPDDSEAVPPQMVFFGENVNNLII